LKSFGDGSVGREGAIEGFAKIPDGMIGYALAEVLKMNVLLIEAILDRYVAKVERREKQWSAREVEALLLKLREEVLDCLK